MQHRVVRKTVLTASLVALLAAMLAILLSDTKGERRTSRTTPLVTPVRPVQEFSQGDDDSEISARHAVPGQEGESASGSSAR